jgi:LysW-gamma-L-alpha-aminoadipyl-6-phosphate/LysW-L-glutamyl-5-phosphate reductase
MGKKARLAIVGGSGFAAAEIIRRVLIHPHFELAHVFNIDRVGAPIATVHHNLEGATSLCFEAFDPDWTGKDTDAVVLSLPRQTAAEWVVRLADAPRILDFSGDFRIRDQASYEAAYEVKHPCPERLGTFVYGLPELHRDTLRGATGVANPGCFATAILLGLLPVARAGWIQGPVRTVAATGSSGSGATPIATTHHPIRAVDLRPYRPLAHQHVPEVEEVLAGIAPKPVFLDFVPVSAPLTRGILATSFVNIPDSIDENQVRRTYSEWTAQERFLRMPEGRLPEVAAVAGSQYVELGFSLGPARDGMRTLVCISALDNLIKGGAGQAVQNLNLMFGYEEATALEDVGSWP